jgi:hypothetical protein
VNAETTTMRLPAVGLSSSARAATSKHRPRSTVDQAGTIRSSVSRASRRSSPGAVGGVTSGPQGSTVTGSSAPRPAMALRASLRAFSKRLSPSTKRITSPRSTTTTVAAGPTARDTAVPGRRSSGRASATGMARRINVRRV